MGGEWNGCCYKMEGVVSFGRVQVEVGRLMSEVSGCIKLGQVT